MSKYRTYQLITWKQFESMYKDNMKIHNGGVEVIRKTYTWYIPLQSIRRFGTMVQAKKLRDNLRKSFTHIDIDGKYLYHKDWFINDFIKEKEMEV